MFLSDIFHWLKPKKEEKVMPKQQTTDQEFVVKYLECTNYDDLAIATGMKSPQTRANKLRKAGVTLPKYGRAKKVLDVAGLNQLIDDIQCNV